MFGRSADRDRCAAIAKFITDRAARGSGGYYGSDAERVLYADGNAAAAGALLGAATVLDDSDLAQRGARVVRARAAVAATSRPRCRALLRRVAARRGLLADQVAAIGALLDAYDVSDGEPYRMMAEELAMTIVRDMWDAGGSGFFDRASALDDIGLLRARRKPFVANAEAAAALARVSRLEQRSGFPDPAGFQAHAEGALIVASAPARGAGSARGALRARPALC